MPRIPGVPAGLTAVSQNGEQEALSLARGGSRSQGNQLGEGDGARAFHLEPGLAWGLIQLCPPDGGILLCPGDSEKLEDRVEQEGERLPFRSQDL